MQRVKNVGYDDDDLYDEDEDYVEEEQVYSAEDRENFAILTPVVRAELEEAGIAVTDLQIEEALWHYYWDVEKAASYLKNARGPQSGQQEPKKAKPKSKFDEAVQQNATKSGVQKNNAAMHGLSKKAEALKLDQAAATQNQPKVKSKGLDVLKLWSEESSTRKPSAAFVVIGHVDHGKSTLMGRLLLDTGAVAQRDIDKYKKQATELGKSSFALAWVMDTGSEERERGVTVDIAQHHFSTENVDFTILDAPGHRDFVPNMIGGTSMADFAVLVVDANQLDSGMKGQTKEHILLARAVGLQRIVVAVNKLDSATPAWSQDTFSSVSREIQGFLRQEGFTENDVAIVPCSGLHGDNVAKAPSASETTSWIRENHLTLLNHLEASLPPPILKEQIEKPFRMQITDVFRGGITNPLSVAGRIASGNIQVGEAVVIQPSGETASVKAIEVSGDGRDWAVAGDLCNLHLVDIDPQYLRSGDAVCNASTPARNVKTFEAKVAAIDSLLPQGVDIHVGRLHVPGLLSQLVNVLNDQDELIKKKPRMIKAGQRATIKVSLDSAVPLEAGTRVVFRSEGSTVAAGTVSTAVA